MDALFAGNFFASQGPEIYLLRGDEEIIYMKCSPAKRIYLATNGRRVQRRFCDDTPLCEAVFDMPKDNTYFRITIEDHNGNHANTNAYLLDEILE